MKITRTDKTKTYTEDIETYATHGQPTCDDSNSSSYKIGRLLEVLAKKGLLEAKHIVYIVEGHLLEDNENDTAVLEKTKQR